MNSERPYDIEPGDEFEETINKLRKRDRVTYQRVIKKMLQIAREPHLGKPLSNVLKGRRRSQVGHFVITYRINEEEHRVVFLRFTHHDEAYK